MKYFSLFSGIGGFELGIKEATNFEWECVGHSEIDKYAEAVYQRHFPESPNYGDATRIEAGDLPDFDLLCAGFPCQSWSVAGKRRGFEDSRGTLFFEIARILEAKRPSYFLLENVKGLLNHSKGDAFTYIIQTLDELRYELQWMVFNSRLHGVAQNRERVFIIGNLRGKSRPEILPFRENASEIHELSEREKEEQILTINLQTRDINRPAIKKRIDAGLKPNAGSGIIYKYNEAYSLDTSLGQAVAKVSGNYHTEDSKPEIGQAMRRYKTTGISPPLNNWSPLIEDTARCLDSNMWKGITPEGYFEKKKRNVVPVRWSRTEKGREERRKHKEETGIDYTPFSDGCRELVEAKEDITGCITNAINKDSLLAVKTPDRKPRQEGRWLKEDEAFSLNCQDRDGIFELGRLRRLTPIECERLQGFPDNWTKYGIINNNLKEISDCQRYKMIGNAVTVNVIKAIIEQWVKNG